MLDVSLRQGHVLKEQNQHPGYYYLMAATYSTQRKLKKGPLVGFLLSFPFLFLLFLTENTLLVFLLLFFFYQLKGPMAADQVEARTQVYVGQMAPKLDHPLDAGVLVDQDPNAESDFILALRTKEATVDHSSIIVDHLSKAYEQFKKFKGTRMTLHTASQIAQEYYEGENYDKALK